MAKSCLRSLWMVPKNNTKPPIVTRNLHDPAPIFQENTRQNRTNLVLQKAALRYSYKKWAFVKILAKLRGTSVPGWLVFGKKFPKILVRNWPK